MIDEHTKFVSDPHFGNIKRRFARTFCFIFARAISDLFAIMYLLYIALFRKLTKCFACYNSLCNIGFCRLSTTLQ